MITTVGKKDLRQLLRKTNKGTTDVFLGVPGRMQELMESFRPSNAMRSMPDTAEAVLTLSCESFIAWLMFCAPATIIAALEECGFAELAYMWRCLHTVVCYSQQYPVRKSELPALMATAKQYCATKQAHPKFGRRYSTFSSFAVRLCPLVCKQAGTQDDTKELDIDDAFGQICRRLKSRQGGELRGVLRAQTLVRHHTLTSSSDCARLC